MGNKNLDINQIYNMKDVELLSKIEKNSIDAVITDPPYFIDIRGMINTNKNIWDSVDSIDVLVKESLLKHSPLKAKFMEKYNQPDENNIQKVNLSKNDRVYVYFYTYIYNLVESGVLKNKAKVIIFNTLENCRMMQLILKDLERDYGFDILGGDFLEYTKYNAHSKASIEKTSEYIISFLVERKSERLKYLEAHGTYEELKKELFKGADSSNPINISKTLSTYYNSLRSKEIFDAINITKGYFVPKVEQKNKGKRIHDTQKPPRLLQYLISNYTKEGDTILDTFSGSGSISMACYELNRNFVACEMLKENYDMSIERFEYFKNSIPLKLYNNDLVDSHFSISNVKYKSDKGYDFDC
ncbi:MULTISPECIES: DNA methyltransferase [Vagococcus]|uniref:Methyltransferase n=1 Tax=Vagococcus fluvialis bH819 TaxID=1255619 RepID=A0A1X6WMB1_9ENTE|nr:MULTISPECIES: DNA methyltransferase [Vagococcus]SLM85473.1 DNA modification methyltransferase [Vagococcus fluvialis bH819]HCM89232.1 site-specific DNA-methyltransferase [Vagococcus sp.]